MDKAQTDPNSEAASAPQEERVARYLRLLARVADVHMDLIEATRTEALEAPQPGVDYGKRLDVIAKSLRLTLLLDDKFAHHRDERRKATAKREAAQEDEHALRVQLAMMAAAYEASKDTEEAERRCAEVAEQLERVEVVELVEASRPEVAVAALCRRWGYPPTAERWLEMADQAMEHYGVRPSDQGDPPKTPPRPGPAGVGGRRPKPPDTG